MNSEHGLCFKVKKMLMVYIYTKIVTHPVAQIYWNKVSNQKLGCDREACNTVAYDSFQVKKTSACTLEGHILEGKRDFTPGEGDS